MNLTSYARVSFAIATVVTFGTILVLYDYGYVGIALGIFLPFWVASAIIYLQFEINYNLVNWRVMR